MIGKTIEKNNILYTKKEKKNVSCLCSKHNSNRKKQVTLLKIPNGEGLHYIAVNYLHY